MMKAIPQKRKLQLNGYSNYIAVPREWVISKNLKKGDPLIFDINEDGNLVIMPAT